jgi:hypothetical protein
MSLHDGARMQLQSLEGHRRILGIVFIVMNALTLLVALGFVALGLAMGPLGLRYARADERDMVTVMTAAFVGATGCLLVMGLPGLITGIGLLKRRRWSRTLALVLGALSLPSMPLGTALGIYTIWFYTQPGSDQVFE